MRRALLAVFLSLAAIGARAERDFLIETEIEPGAVYVGAEAVLRVRLLRAPGVPYGVLRPPAVDAVAEIWPLGRVQWSETKRGERTWQVHERAYLILPRQAGRIEIPGAELEGPLRQAMTSAASSGNIAARLRGPRLQLEVREPPADAEEPWLPARALTLEESWSRDPARLAVGVPVTRTVTIRVEGLPAKRLPLPPAFEHPALRAHPDQPDLATEQVVSGTTARAVQRVVLVPLDEAEVVLPEFRVRWWDVLADVPRVATLPARTLRLRPAAALAPPGPRVPADSPVPFLRAAIAALVLLLAGGLWWHARTHLRREARRKLRKACRANDGRAARDALLEWSRVIRPDLPTSLVQHLGEAWDATARGELRALDAALYGRRAWDGRRFWREVRPWLRKEPSRGGRPSPHTGFFRLQAGDEILRPDPLQAAVARVPR